MRSLPAANLRRRRSKLAVHVAAICLLGSVVSGCLGYDGDITHGYIADPQALADVRPGQTAEQVLVTLGTPSTTSTVGGDAWYYISSKTERSIAFMQPTITERRVTAVYFDKGKKVTRVGNYGLQDGKVVNFASGATATFGSDAGFIKGLFLNFNPLGTMLPKT